MQGFLGMMVIADLFIVFNFISRLVLSGFFEWGMLNGILCLSEEFD